MLLLFVMWRIPSLIDMFLINMILVALPISLYAVDRTNFKTCAQSGFCSRQRDHKPPAPLYRVVPESLDLSSANAGRVRATLEHKTELSSWSLEITKLTSRVFRVTINEIGASRARYQMKPGESLVNEPALGSLQVVDRRQEPSGLVELRGAHGATALLQLDPFRFDTLLDGRPLISFNARGLLKMEQQKKRQAPESAPASESSGSPDASPTEEFKGHVDSLPFGTQSIGVDATFPGFNYVYGLPQHADSLALRNTDQGDPYRLYNLDVFEYELNNPMALYSSVPLLWAHNVNNTAGLFLHNPSELWVDIKSNRGDDNKGALSRLWSSLVGNSDTAGTPKDASQVDTHWMAEAGVIDAFFMLGDSPKEVFKLYGELTGTTPLPPMWSIAYHQCRWNYNDQEDVRQVDMNFDKHDIPFDVIWLDIEHTDGKKYFTWDKSKFPSPKAMIENLDAKRRKLVTVVDPHIKRDDGWDLFKEARDKSLFVRNKDGADYEGWCWPGSSSWLDFTSSTVRRWWAERFAADKHEGSCATNQFTWNDMGEPSVFNGPEITMHKDALHADGWEHREVHNLFGMQIHRASWEGQLLRSNDQERPFVLTRAGFAGSQRYGAIWTGDNAAEWEHLRASLPMVMSLSVTGITFAGADVGGFFKNPDPELLVRWYQAGAFQPFFRAHAHLDTKRREPWIYLEKEKMAIVRDVIRLRYALLPYWYTCFQASADSGEPIMAPLWVHFPRDARTFGLDDQHMVGPALLVKPVTAPGVTSLPVYLPGVPHDVWYSASDWSSAPGGQEVSVAVGLATVPLFHRGGHMVVKRERVRRSSQLGAKDPLTLIVALDRLGQATGQLYLDDFHSHRYRAPSREFALMRFEFAGGVLSSRRVDAAADASQVKVVVERIVVVGFSGTPAAITVTIPSQPAKPAEFFHSPSAAGVLIIRQPGVLAAEEWSIAIKKHDEL